MLRYILAVSCLAWSVSVAAQTVDGSAIFKRCVACHQANGAGVQGAFPPLTRHLGPKAASVAGREYLIMVLSAGLSGEISVDGKNYRGMMPAQAGLKPPEMAAVLNHVLSTWNADTLPKGWIPFTAQEVQVVRDKYKNIRATDVRVMREKIPTLKTRSK